jgi:hypothetical protein
MTSALRLTAAAVSLSACLLFTGCHIVTHKDGNNDNVDIGTPFGSMHVNTNKDSDTTAIGLTQYPGSVPVKDDGDKDANSANVDMSFGSFHLGVKAASFQTPDAPDKVVAFYRKDLSKFGDVIECRGKQTIGSPSRTSQGLTCADEERNHISAGSDTKSVHMNGLSSDHDDNLELRAGSETHQHIVGVEPKDGGTKIGLVALELPSQFKSKSGNNPE